MKEYKVVGMGYENYIDRKRIIAVLNVDSAPARKLVKKAEEDGVLVDVTAGRRRKSVILTDCNSVFITAKNPNTIIKDLCDE